MDHQSHQTTGSHAFRVVSVLEVGRDCRFPRIPCGLGAGRGTRLLVFGESEWSRCRKWDETVGFWGFRAVSVPMEGRDCRFQGNPCGLGAEGGTRLPVFGESEWSRCRKRDETAGFRGFREVSVLGVGRDHTDSGCRGGDGPRNFYARSLPPASSRGGSHPIVSLFAF